MKRIVVLCIIGLSVLLLTVSNVIVPVTTPAMAQLRQNVATTDTTSIKAPGVSAAIYVGSGYGKVLWYFKVTSMNTKVSVALQAKVGESQWTSVYTDSLAITADGNYGLEWNNAALADSVRFKFIAEAGGTDAIITHNAVIVGGM